jgi:hypothetical protein
MAFTTKQTCNAGKETRNSWFLLYTLTQYKLKLYLNRPLAYTIRDVTACLRFNTYALPLGSSGCSTCPPYLHSNKLLLMHMTGFNGNTCI